MIIQNYKALIKKIFKLVILSIKLNKNDELEAGVYKNGIAILPKLISEQQCQGLTVLIDKLIEEESYSWKDKDGADIRIYEAQKYSLVQQALELFQPKIDNIAKKYTSNNELIYTTLIARIEYKKGNLGSGGGWHRDSSTPQFKSIVYLSDVQNHSGPFQIITGSASIVSTIYTWLFYKIGPSKLRVADNQANSIGEIQNQIGEKGDCLLVNTNIIHRGKPIENGRRYALTQYFFESESAKIKFLNKLKVD